MPHFSYVARDGSGRSQTGVMESPSAAMLVNDLRARGWLVLNVNPVASAGRSIVTRLSPSAWLRPRALDVELSLQQLAVMIRSGLTLLTALQTVSEQARRASMAEVWAAVAERIQDGSSLGDAMAEHRCFPQIVIRLVRVGEQTGILDEVLERAASALESGRTLRNDLVTALMYPLIVLIVAVGATAFMLGFVIPKLQVTLEKLGRELPAMTQVLIDLSVFLRTQGTAIGVVVLMTLGLIVSVYLWAPGRYWLDRILLRLPVFGTLFRLAGTSVFARNLSVLLHSGITLIEGLRTAEILLANTFLARRVREAREAVIEGAPLAEPLAHKSAFMPMLSRMVAVGEAAGTLDEVLVEVADFHESQLQRTIRRFSAIVEPLMIIVVGGIVGYVYIAFFATLFSAYGG